MGRLKKLVQIGLLVCMIAMISTAMALQVEAAILGEPTIVGDPTVGEPLLAVVTPEDAVVTYQWRLNGQKIPGATASQYTPTEAGVEIDVVVTTVDGDLQSATSRPVTIKKKDNNYVLEDEDLIVVHVNKRGEASGQVISAVNDPNIVLEYYDYVCETPKWDYLPATNLPAGIYQIRIKATTDTKESNSLFVRVKEPASPPTEADLSITHVQIAGSSTGILKNNTDKPLELLYAGSWIEEFPVSGLRAGPYQVRFQTTTDYLASEPITVYVKEPTTLKISPLDVVVTHVTSRGGSNGGIAAAAADLTSAVIECEINGEWKTLPVTSLRAGVYPIRYAETLTTFASEACNIVVKEPAEAPSLGDIKVTDVSTYGGNTGAILGLQTAWQVSYDGNAWHDLDKNSLTGLSAGTYYFRTKASDYYLASEVISVNVRQPEMTPEATIDYVNGTLKNLASGAEYIIDGITDVAENGAISIFKHNLTGRTVTIVKKGNGVTTINSDKQSLSIPVRPAVPDAPVVTERTDTEITVAFTEGLEYSIDGETWMTAVGDSYTFDQLTAATSYIVYARVKAIDGISFHSASAGTPTVTLKGSEDAVPPKAIIPLAITDTSITIQVVNGQEYRLGNSAWITPPGSTIQWTELNENTNYTIMTRTAKTEDVMYSASISQMIATYEKLKITSWTVDYWKKGITGLIDGGVYTLNGGDPIVVGEDGMIDVEDYFGRSVKLRRLGSVETETVDSDVIEIAIDSPTAAPTNAQFDPARDVQTTLDSLIIPTPPTTMEYQLLDADGLPISAWKSSTGDAIVFDGLTDSTPYRIQVSYRQTDTAPKSNALISDLIYTKFYEDMPAAKVDTLTERLTGLVANAAYLIDGVTVTADAKGTVAVVETWINKEITVIKCGDQIKSVDSHAQTLKLPDRADLIFYPFVNEISCRGGSNGSISGVTSDMEYSADNGSTWIAVQSDAITGLSAKDYMLRVKAVAGKSFASKTEVVTVAENEPLIRYKDLIKNELEEVYRQKEESGRYTEDQLSQLRALLDAGMKNIDESFDDLDDIQNAQSTILDNMAQVPCSNTPTPDGKMVGEDILLNDLLQYPTGSDEVWGNISNPDGLDSDLVFVIEKLGQSATEALRAQIEQGIADGTIRSFDGAMSAADVAAALKNGELKVGLEITLVREDAAIDTFKGTYTVTMLLPADVQGVQNLCIVSFGEDGSMEFHPATIVGNYLSFETDHFSTYGIVGLNAVTISRQQMLTAMENLRASLDEKDYSRDNWKKVNEAVDQAVDKVENAQTEEDINGAWTELLDRLSDIKTKSKLGWLWILILILVVLIAVIVACFLVWRVRYFDGEERIANEFHFWGTKVALLAWSKDGYVLDGWYHDPELTDRAENGFPMPWQGVKLYAKWEKVEILSTEEESVTEEELPPQEPVIAELPMADEESPAEETVEQLPEAEAVAELQEEPQEIAEAQEEPAVDETPAEQDVNEEVVAEEDDATAEGETETEEKVETEDVEDESETVLMEVETLPEKEREDIVFGEVENDNEEDSFAVSTDEDSYKNTRSYKAWLEFGEEDADLTADEEEKQLEDGDEVQLFTNEKTGEKYHIRFNLSFRAKMAGLSEESKEFYRDLKSEFLTYKGVKSRISWKTEGIRKGRETIARFAVRENTLCVFLALDPDAYKDSKYVFESVKDVKAYEGVPMLIRVKSDLSCRKVKELIADIMQPRKVVRMEDAPVIDYSHLYDDTTTEARLREGQLRIWAEGPDAQVCASRAATATLHYLICPEVTAEEADALITDDMLDALLPPAEGILIVADQVQEITIEQLCKKFYVGDVVDVEALKDKGLMDPAMSYVKITSTGEMTKKMTVCAHMFERTAAKMILLTGGDATIITE